MHKLGSGDSLDLFRLLRPSVIRIGHWKGACGGCFCTSGLVASVRTPPNPSRRPPVCFDDSLQEIICVISRNYSCYSEMFSFFAFNLLSRSFSVHFKLPGVRSVIPLSDSKMLPLFSPFIDSRPRLTLTLRGQLVSKLGVKKQLEAAPPLVTFFPAWKKWHSRIYPQRNFTSDRSQYIYTSSL